MLLNDWSIAADCDTETTVQGNTNIPLYIYHNINNCIGRPTVMPSELFLQPAHFKCHPQSCHDVESVVKMFYLFLFPGECPVAQRKFFSFGIEYKRYHIGRICF